MSTANLPSNSVNQRLHRSDIVPTDENSKVIRHHKNSNPVHHGVSLIQRTATHLNNHANHRPHESDLTISKQRRMQKTFKIGQTYNRCGTPFPDIERNSPFRPDQVSQSKNNGDENAMAAKDTVVSQTTTVSPSDSTVSNSSIGTGSDEEDRQNGPHDRAGSLSMAQSTIPANQSQSTESHSRQQMRPMRQKNLNFACSNCRRAHKACCGGRPCERCSKLGLENCESTVRKKRMMAKRPWHSFLAHELEQALIGKRQTIQVQSHPDVHPTQISHAQRTRELAPNVPSGQQRFMYLSNGVENKRVQRQPQPGEIMPPYSHHAQHLAVPSHYNRGYQPQSSHSTTPSINQQSIPFVPTYPSQQYTASIHPFPPLITYRQPYPNNIQPFAPHQHSPSALDDEAVHRRQPLPVYKKQVQPVTASSQSIASSSGSSPSPPPPPVPITLPSFNTIMQGLHANSHYNIQAYMAQPGTCNTIPHMGLRNRERSQQ